MNGPAAEATVYASTVGKPEDNPTYPRVLEHSNRLEAREWQTHNQNVYQVPTQRANDLRVYHDPSTLGARDAIAHAEMRLQASKALPPQLTTDYMARFETPSMEGLNCGRIVMQTQDYVPIPLSSRDATFQAEVGMNTKANIDSKLVPTPDPATVSTNYLTDMPVTLYTEKAKGGKLPGQGG